MSLHQKIIHTHTHTTLHCRFTRREGILTPKAQNLEPSNLWNTCLILDWTLRKFCQNNLSFNIMHWLLCLFYVVGIIMDFWQYYQVSHKWGSSLPPSFPHLSTGSTLEILSRSSVVFFWILKVYNIIKWCVLVVSLQCSIVWNVKLNFDFICVLSSMGY
jgi:hypothetical protein